MLLHIKDIIIKYYNRRRGYCEDSPQNLAFPYHKEVISIVECVDNNENKVGIRHELDRERSCSCSCTCVFINHTSTINNLGPALTLRPKNIFTQIICIINALFSG